MRNTVTFALNNRIERVSQLAGDTTLLNWLRQTRKLTGSKEGCAEGDCGACTVVLARRLADGTVTRLPVNACIQLLGMLEGASVTTVEGITPPDGGLHPCQGAMVEHHGSQCGFCTPGFVMSLFAAWSNREGLAADDIDTTLAGNLCRCTGYRPIVDAAARLAGRGRLPDYEKARQKREAKLLAEMAHDESVSLSAGGTKFVSPATSQDFERLIATSPRATVLAGASDVGLWITKQHRDLGEIVWLGRVAEFSRMERSGAHWRIGPAVTLGQAMDRLGAGRPAFAEVMRRFASVQVRATGTVCGNIANGSPIGDLPPMLIALDSRVEIAGKGKRRELPLEAFFIEYGRQDRGPGEYVAALLVPAAPSPHFRAYKISKRFDQDISAVMGAFNIETDGAGEDARITSARIAFGGMAGTPARAPAAEAALTGARLRIANFQLAAKALAKDFAPISDMRASADYRGQVAANLVLRYGLDLTGAPVPRLAGSAPPVEVAALGDMMGAGA